MVVGVGFEPTKGRTRRFYRPLLLATQPPNHLQIVAPDKNWCARQELNLYLKLRRLP